MGNAKADEKLKGIRRKIEKRPGSTEGLRFFPDVKCSSEAKEFIDATESAGAFVEGVISELRKFFPNHPVFIDLFTDPSDEVRSVLICVKLDRYEPESLDALDAFYDGWWSEMYGLAPIRIVVLTDL